jgi:hypothetical protein
LRTLPAPITASAPQETGTTSAGEETKITAANWRQNSKIIAIRQLRAGRLRFVLAVARSANGTREQLRIYFDEAGKRLWKTDKLLKGLGCPGCFSAYYDSDERLAFDPAKDFAIVAGCHEAKPDAK